MIGESVREEEVGIWDFSVLSVQFSVSLKLF